MSTMTTVTSLTFTEEALADSIGRSLAAEFGLGDPTEPISNADMTAADIGRIVASNIFIAATIDAVDSAKADHDA